MPEQGGGGGGVSDEYYVSVVLVNYETDTQNIPVVITYKPMYLPLEFHNYFTSQPLHMHDINK